MKKRVVILISSIILGSGIITSVKNICGEKILFLKANVEALAGGEGGISGCVTAHGMCEITSNGQTIQMSGMALE